MKFLVKGCQLQAFKPQTITVRALLERMAMEFVCRHCDQATRGRPYRVISEEDGVILLDMIVCNSCHEQARQLGLHAEEIKLEYEPRGQRRWLIESHTAPALRG